VTKRRLVVALGLALLLGGCAAVQPWERGHLARRAMTAGLGDSGLAGRYRAKLVETKTAHGTAAAAPGGGCGCSQ
jgi:hypothetical protein